MSSIHRAHENYEPDSSSRAGRSAHDQQRSGGVNDTRLMLLTSDDTRTLIDELFAEQQRLTAVERFAQRHDGGGLPAQAKFYRALLPAAAPGPGQQYAFAVDLDACSGCKACVTACHSLNGLDEPETWRSVGLLHGGTVDAPWQQNVTSA